jgi:hypothetical protein
MAVNFFATDYTDFHRKRRICENLCNLWPATTSLHFNINSPFIKPKANKPENDDVENGIQQ